MIDGTTGKEGFMPGELRVVWVIFSFMVEALHQRRAARLLPFDSIRF